MLKLIAATTAALLASAAPTWAQQAPTGPLTTVSNQPDRVFLLVPPPAGPSRAQPVRTWAWTIFKTPRAGGMDAMAVQYAFDCSARTVATVYAETYADRTPLAGQATPGAPQAVQPGTINEAFFNAACNPSPDPGAERFANVEAVRLAILRMTPGR